MMFASVAVGLPLPVINLIAALVYFFVNKSKGLFVHFHAFQSLISQLPTTVVNVVSIFWVVRIYFFDWPVTDLFRGYLAMVIILNLVYFVFSIVGAMRARKGRMYYFLFFGRLSYKTVFRVKDTGNEKNINLPPK